MAKTRRSSIENMFAKKGGVQPQKKETVKEEPQIQEPEEVVAKAPVETEDRVEVEATKKTAVKEVKEPEVVEEVEAEEPKEETKEEPKAEPKTEPKKKPSEKSEEKVSRPAAIDNLFTKKKKERGHQQTVYLKKEVYDFCNEIAETYEIGMSDVVNKLILSIMEDAE